MTDLTEDEREELRRLRSVIDEAIGALHHHADDDSEPDERVSAAYRILDEAEAECSVCLRRHRDEKA